MNTAAYVDALAENLKTQVSSGGIPLSKAVWDAARACEGWAYVYGGWFALCTPSERRKRLGYSPSHTTIKTKCKGFDSGNCKGCQWYPGDERTRCGDCRGFTDYLLKLVAQFDLYGDMVSTQWNHASNWCAKGKVADGIPQNILVNLFVYKDGKWTHTGFGYNGETMEASSGVQYSSKTNSKWTHWAVAACFKDEYEALKNGANQPSEPSDDNPSYTVLKRGDKGQKVKELQRLLINHGYSLPKYGCDGDFGKETEAAVKQLQRDWGLKETGIMDDESWQRLLTAPGRPKQYEVTITGLSESEADALCDKYENATKKEMGT